MATKTRIIKAAVVRLGEEAPQAITDDTDPLIAADAMYDSLVEEALTKHAWSFATRMRAITKTATEPPEPWDYEFATPAGVLNVRDIYDADGYRVDYELVENLLYTRQEGPLTLVYTWAASEERWPADFAGAIEEELLGRLLGAFGEPIRSIEVREIAMGKLDRAIVRDRRQNPPRRLSRAPLLNAWFGRATRRP